MAIKQPKQLPAFVEAGPDEFISIEDLTVDQLRRALVVEHLARQDKRFRELMWLRRRLPEDAKDSDLVLEQIGIKPN